MSRSKEQRKKRVLKELERNPIVQIACLKTGVARTSFYRWRQEDRSFDQAATDAREEGYLFTCEMTESQVLKKIKEGHFPAMRFWLEKNSKHYGRTDNDQENDNPMLGWGDLLGLAYKTIDEEGLEVDPETGKLVEKTDKNFDHK